MSTVTISQFSNGSIADANAVNADLNTIANVINGNLDDTNISSSAAINGSKILVNSLPVTALANQDGWQPSGETWVYGANNGNKEYTVTISGDKTGKYSPGMKVKLPRVTTPPTQAMSFTAASSQYAGKASPTGIALSTAFTCEGWIYLNSYPAANQTIVSKWNSTDGWIFYINSNGQVKVHYYSGGTSTSFQSYQSIPLKRWVHVAGVISSVASKTGAVYVNGTLVPSSSPETTATALGNPATNLIVGSYNLGAAGSFFDGFMSEVRVWSAAQSQAQIQANMNINLVGNETNLVALFQGNGNYTDTTSNANTLTAAGGATFATQNPYNATEYGIITKAAYSNPNTTLTIFTGTDNNIPNQTLGSPSYSLQRSPYGFQAGRNRWILETLLRTSSSNSGVGSLTTFINNGFGQLQTPSGDWLLETYGTAQINGSTAVTTMEGRATIGSTSSTGEVMAVDMYTNASATAMMGAFSMSRTINLTATQTYYLNIYVQSAGSIVTGGFRGDIGDVVIRATSAYI